MQKNKGFTLLELLVVIAIIALIATIGFVALENARRQARDAVRVADFQQIRKALQLYYDENGQYPAPLNGVPWFDTSFTNSSDWIPGIGAYMANLPVDPVNKGEAASSGVGHAPWFIGDNYTYQYSSFDRGNGYQEYNLIGQLEDPNHELRCENKCWKFNTDSNDFRTGDSWCPQVAGCNGKAGQFFDLDLFSDHNSGELDSL